MCNIPSSFSLYPCYIGPLCQPQGEEILEAESLEQLAETTEVVGVTTRVGVPTQVRFQTTRPLPGNTPLQGATRHEKTAGIIGQPQPVVELGELSCGFLKEF